MTEAEEFEERYKKEGWDLILETMGKYEAYASIAMNWCDGYLTEGKYDAHIETSLDGYDSIIDDTIPSMLPADIKKLAGKTVGWGWEDTVKSGWLELDAELVPTKNDMQNLFNAVGKLEYFHGHAKIDEETSKELQHIGWDEPTMEKVREENPDYDEDEVEEEYEDDHFDWEHPAPLYFDCLFSVNAFINFNFDDGSGVQVGLYENSVDTF